MRFFICISGAGCCSSHDSENNFFNRLIYIETPDGPDYISLLQRIDYHAVRGSGYVSHYQVEELKVRKVL